MKIGQSAGCLNVEHVCVYFHSKSYLEINESRAECQTKIRIYVERRRKIKRPKWDYEVFRSLNNYFLPSGPIAASLTRLESILETFENASKAKAKKKTWSRQVQMVFHFSRGSSARRRKKKPGTRQEENNKKRTKSAREQIHLQCAERS